MATALSGAAIAGTIGTPIASAMPVENVGPHQPNNGPVVAPPAPYAPSVTEAKPDGGFDLSSAAIGAAAGGGLLIVVLAAGGMAWGRPTSRRHDAASA